MIYVFLNYLLENIPNAIFIFILLNCYAKLSCGILYTGNISDCSCVIGVVYIFRIGLVTYCSVIQLLFYSI